jgi:tRNA pseudouridine13 synthase
VSRTSDRAGPKLAPERDIDVVIRSRDDCRVKLHPELPGVGGAIKTAPEDFIVEELPAYLPSGDGEHTYFFVEKRGLNTEELLVEMCRRLGASRGEAGCAGMKDRQAVTRQWVSIPRVEPQTIAGDKWRVLSASRHGNKLRTGHLRGNRFTIVVRGLRCPIVEAVQRATAILTALERSGLPNRFGPQRFGVRGDNAARGRALLDGKGSAGRGEKRLFVSALQAELFNAYLDDRTGDRTLRTVIAGDVLQKRDSGGLFTPDDLAEAQARLERGELDVTGPMFGSKMRAATLEAGAREAALLARNGLQPSSFERLGPIAEGTRRPLTVPVGEARAELGDEPDTLRLGFTLPSGAYATVLVDEIIA